MCSYYIKEFKVGLKILLDGLPYVIQENEFFKPGKGQALNRLKLKNLLNGVIIRKNIKIGEEVEVADILEKEVKFLYFDKCSYHFIDVCTYEYYEVPLNIVGENSNWIKDEMVCVISFWESVPIFLKLPKVVTLKVISTEDISKNSVSSKNFKNSTLETGVVIKLPIFIRVGDEVKIDTEKFEYLSRVP